MESKGTFAAVAQVITTRTGIFEVLIVAVVLALAINLLSSAIPSLLGLGAGYVMAIGLLLVAGCAMYSAYRLLGTKSRNFELEGWLPYRVSRNELLKVPDYAFANQIADYLKAILAENAVYKKWWDEEPLGRGPAAAKPGEKPSIPKSVDLIHEAMEYFVLQLLCKHLRAYFESVEGAQLNRFSRRDLPDLLLTNRFLEAFSKPMEERPSFLDGPKGWHVARNTSDGLSEVWSAHSASGTFFDRFELTLPKNAALRRLSPTSLEIETARFRLSFDCGLPGYITFVPLEYKTLIQGLPLDEVRDLDVLDYMAKLWVEVKFKRGALIWPMGWNYYKWVDSFLEELEKKFGRERYFTRIGWESSFAFVHTASQLATLLPGRTSTKRPAMAGAGDREPTQPET